MTTRGRLLGDMAALQARDDAAVAYPAVQVHANNVIANADRLGHPVLMPVGDHAVRLLGVVEVASRGASNVAGWTTDLTGQQVLLVGTVAMSLIEFEMAASVARSRGAVAVHGCAVEIAGPVDGNVLDSFAVLAVVPVDLPWTA